jgi:hypothetical protein
MDSLEQLYDNGSMPAIPEGERAGRARRSEEGAGSARLAGVDVTKRRRLFAAGGALALVALVAVLLWPIGVLTGDDGDGGGSGADTTAAASTGNPAGAAVILGQGDQRAVQVQATGLEPSTRDFAYQFWLYDSQGKAKSLGAQVTDKNGTLTAIGVLPKGFEKYRYFDLSREPLKGDAGHSGQSVLRGAMPKLAQVNGNKVTRLGQVVLSPPAG